MTTSDDSLPAAVLLLGGGVAGYAAGRFLLARVLDERERATASGAAIAVAAGVPLALAAPPTALIDPYPEPVPPPKPSPSAAPSATTATPPTAAHEPSHATSGSTAAPGPVATSAPATPIDPYPATPPGTVPPMTRPARVPSKPPLARDFDRVFETYRGSIPIEFLRALVTRESDMNPAERKGPAWGLMQIIEAVRVDYNRAHKTKHTREHLLDPRVNVAIGCWLLRAIVKSYEKHHADVPNLRTDWTNRRWLELVVFGWNAGYSERGGVGKVAHYLKQHGLPVTLDNVWLYADVAGASRHLQRRDKRDWSKSVVELYLAERDAKPRGAAGDDAPALVRFRGMKDWHELHIALKQFFADRRGFDLNQMRQRVPRTTNDDIRQLVAMWDRCAASAKLDIHGVKGAVEAWREVSADATRHVTGAAPDTVYADNDRFWRISQRLAIRVQVGAEEPPEITLVDAFAKSIKATPGRIVDAIQSIAGAGGDAAQAVGSGIKDAVVSAADTAGDALAAVGRPLLIGAGIVGAGVLAVVLLRD